MILDFPGVHVLATLKCSHHRIAPLPQLVPPQHVPHKCDYHFSVQAVEEAVGICEHRVGSMEFELYGLVSPCYPPPYLGQDAAPPCHPAVVVQNSPIQNLLPLLSLLQIESVHDMYAKMK